MASQGDVRVLVVLDLVLSFVFSLLVISGLEFVGMATFSWPNVALGALVVAAITYVVVLRE